MKKWVQQLLVERLSEARPKLLPWALSPVEQQKKITGTHLLWKEGGEKEQEAWKHVGVEHIVSGRKQKSQRLGCIKHLCLF